MNKDYKGVRESFKRARIGIWICIVFFSLLSCFSIFFKNSQKSTDIWIKKVGDNLVLCSE